MYFNTIKDISNFFYVGILITFKLFQFLGRRTTTMPSMQMFGRRWLAGTDDLVFPGLLELLMRGIW